MKAHQIKFLVNGEQSSSIDVNDRGLQFGDGVFETIRVHQGRPVWWQQHMDRLLEGCRRLRFTHLPDDKVLRAEACELSADCLTGTLKIIVTRGTSSSGYAAPADIMPNRVLQLRSGTRHQSKSGQGIMLGISEQRITGSQQLSGIKHLNRLEQVLARMQCQAEGWDECIMLDIEDKVVEGSMSNLFIWQQDRLLTPLLGQAGIKGICRERIMSVAAAQGIDVQQCQLGLDDLQKSDGLFVCNSLIGIWPVVRYAGRAFDTGANTRLLQAQLEAEICSAE